MSEARSCANEDCPDGPKVVDLGDEVGSGNWIRLEWGDKAAHYDACSVRCAEAILEAVFKPTLDEMELEATA